MIPLLIHPPVRAPIEIKIRIAGYVFFMWESMASSAIDQVRPYFKRAMAKVMTATSNRANCEGPAVTWSLNTRTLARRMDTSRIIGMRLVMSDGFFIYNV